MGRQREVRWEFVRKILEAVRRFEGAEKVVDAFYIKLVGQMAGQTVRGDELVDLRGMSLLTRDTGRV